MGAGRAFERRRNELAIIKKEKENITDDKVNITDEDVQNSYVTENQPIPNNLEDFKNKENFIQQYLVFGRLLHFEFQLNKYNSATLFMHGGITKVESLGKVPGSADTEVDSYLNITSWVDDLQKWKKEQLDIQLESYNNFDEKYCTNIKERPQAKLIDYGHPQKSVAEGGIGQDQTVTYNDFWKKGEPKELDPALVDKLLALRVKNIVVGHKPHIDSPLVIKSPSSSDEKKQVQVVSADTSQSKMGAKSDWGVNNRGDKTKSEVVVQEDRVIRLHGQLADEKTQDFKLSDDEKIGTYYQGEVDGKDGKKLNVKWFQKAIVNENSQDKQLLCWAKGFDSGCKYSDK